MGFRREAMCVLHSVRLAMRAGNPTTPIGCRETTTQLREVLGDLERGRLDLAIARLRTILRERPTD